MNRLRNVLLRKCRSLSHGGGGGRSSMMMSSYSSLRSMSARDAAVADDADEEVGADDGAAVVFVGSSRRRYVISAEHLEHPLVAALLVGDSDGDGKGDVCGGIDDGGGKRRSAEAVAVNCEVVLFDHLLWMLDSGAVDLREDDGGGEDAVRELAQLYSC